jgi:tetratricopeptide (TPR) repeat protein
MAARSERRCAIGSWVLPALLIAAPSSALSQAQQPAGSDPPPEAMSHFDRGREHFRAGRYREAIVELKAALEIDPDSPTLMYNVAYASELLGDIEESIVYYRKYLDALPASANAERKKIKVTLKRLEGHREQVEATPEPQAADPLAEPQPAAPVAPPPEPRASGGLGRADALFWVTLGGGVAMLGGAAVTGMLALDREDAVAQFVVGEDGSIADRKELIEEADRFALTSDLLIGGGATLVAAAALLFLLRDPEDEPDEESASVRPLLTRDGRTALLLVHGSF